MTSRILSAAAALAALALSALASTGAAQATPGAGDTPALRAALDRLRADNAWTLEQQQALCEIPAPPFKESTRAAAFQRALTALGYAGVRIDSIGNVIAERRGTGPGPTIVIAGHLDTVFPEGTAVKVKRSGTRMDGPGIGDDCRGLAVVLSVARAYQLAQVRTQGTVYFVGNVGEEGPGNSRGIRYLLGSGMKGKVDYFISVDGTGLGVTSRAVGSHRYRVHYKGPGGHSYGAFGMPNPIHAMGRAIAAIADLQVPTSPKTTFNVGVVSGGTSVNSIPFEGTMELDMRSESAQALDALDAQARRAMQSALDAENARWPASKARLTVQIDTIGLRPAGAQPDSAAIVRAAYAAARTLGFDPGATTASSTDANVAIALGVPGIAIDGGGKGSGAHSLAESYDDGDRGWLGPQWAAMIVARLAGQAAGTVTP